MGWFGLYVHHREKTVFQENLNALDFQGTIRKRLEKNFKE
jgi:hypothetical protein